MRRTTRHSGALAAANFRVEPLVTNADQAHFDLNRRKDEAARAATALAFGAEH
jgi:hypothetical protein